jgi:RimJ/RimL family protein N-acetyltransferase
VKFLYGNEKSPKLHERFCEYAAQQIFHDRNDFGPSGTLGVFLGSKLAAVVVLHGWQPDYGIIEISAAATDPRWLTRQSIREIMGICFEQHGCQQIVSRMATDNDKAIRIYEFLKFKKILLPNMRGKGKDEYLMLLTADEWRENKMNRID